MNKKEPVRKVYVLRQVEIPWSELKAGDIFRTEKTSPTDLYAEEDTWRRAVSAAERRVVGADGSAPASWGVQQDPAPMFKDFMPPVVPTYTPDDETLADLLGLVDVDVLPSEVAQWSQEDQWAAEKWAGKTHLKASDNNVRVPPKPAFLGPYPRMNNDGLWPLSRRG